MMIDILAKIKKAVSPDNAIEKLYFKPIRKLAKKSNWLDKVLRKLPLARKAFEDDSIAEGKPPLGVGA